MYIIAKITAPEPLADMLKAELADIGFDAFIEEDGYFEATAEKQHFDSEKLSSVLAQYAADGPIPCEIREEEKQNWNKLWESNFDPIAISQDCYIRAEFHQPSVGYRFELVITPKMSFGTGHHATTALMIRNVMAMDNAGKRVIDLGCGTGVLGIMAAKLGASHVDACDIEDWSVENTFENASVNGVVLHAFQGTALLAEGNEPYDLVLANINKHVVLEEMPIYVRLLRKGGHLLLSGFYVHDVPDLEAVLKPLGMEVLWMKEQSNWASLVCRK